MKFSFPHSAAVKVCCMTLEAVAPITQSQILTLDQKSLLLNLTMNFHLYVKVNHCRVI